MHWLGEDMWRGMEVKWITCSEIWVETAGSEWKLVTGVVNQSLISLMNRNRKDNLANQMQRHIKNIIPHDQIRFIQKPVNVIALAIFMSI